MPLKNWTKKEEESLIQMFNRGMKQIIIARKLGRTRPSIVRKICRLRNEGRLEISLYHRHGYMRLAEQVRKLSGTGISDTDIALVLDVSKMSVRRARHQLGLPPGVMRRDKKGGWQRGDKGGTKAAIIRLYGRWGMSDAEMSRRIGVSKSAIQQFRIRLKLLSVGNGRNFAKNKLEKSNEREQCLR